MANGRSSMTSSALAAVLVDDSTGTGGNRESLGIELLQRVTRDDYKGWLNTVLASGGCVRPVRLRGTVRHVDTTTGEVLYGLDTKDLPDKAIYVPCGDRRASVCPPCAETYRADTYQLIRAGLAGGKGMPESLAAHPCVFATFTAPSFGPVHTRVIGNSGRVARCRPRRKARQLGVTDDAALIHECPPSRRPLPPLRPIIAAPQRARDRRQWRFNYVHAKTRPYLENVRATACPGGVSVSHAEWATITESQDGRPADRPAGLQALQAAVRLHWAGCMPV
jgi:hypothetical protein